MTEDARLNLFDKEEWWDVVRRVSPEVARETFEEMWAANMRAKERKRLQ